MKKTFILHLLLLLATQQLLAATEPEYDNNSKVLTIPVVDLTGEAEQGVDKVYNLKGGEYLAPLPTIYCAAINR